MNLNQLKFACSLAQHGSFTAAASECCVTQPTLSNAIAQLEDELGQRLFIRTTRSVSLTPFGQHSLPHMLEVLAAQEKLLHQVKNFLAPNQTLIRIGTSPLLNSKLLGRMIEAFRLNHPDVEVVLREMNMSDLHRMLSDDLLDFVFGVTKMNSGMWQETFLYEEPLLFIPTARTTTWQPKANSKSVQMKDISKEIYVMVPDACGLARTTRTLFRSHRRKLNEYSGEAMSYQVLEEWANLGIGAAILPKSKVGASLASTYTIIDKNEQQVNISFNASWSGNKGMSPHLALFADYLQKDVPVMLKQLQIS